jgi:hypothetical protein
MSIAPTANAVRQWQLNQMLDEIVATLDQCRKIWWQDQTTTCLENKWLMRISPGKLDVLDDRRAGARQVRSAQYDAQTLTTVVTFRGGTEDRIESGDGG